MRLTYYWAASRLLVLLALASLAYGFMVPAPGAIVLTVTLCLTGAWLVARGRWQLGSEPEPIGTRAGLTAWAADSLLLLALAWIAPIVVGMARNVAPSFSVAVVQAFALLTVAHMWLRVARDGNPVTRAGFTHPVLVLAVALTAWLLVERSVPSGHGAEQALVATLLAGVVAAVTFAGAMALAGRRRRLSAN